MQTPTAQPELERHVSSESVRAGARLLRGTSQLFTGSADGSHHNRERAASPGTPTETTPLTEAQLQRHGFSYQAPAFPIQGSLIRQQSQVSIQANRTQDEVHERISADAMELFTRNLKWIALAAVIFFILSIAILVITILAMYAAVVHTEQCDQPLTYYILVVMLWGLCPSRIQQFVTNETWTWKGYLALSFVLAVPSWCIIGWGVYMIENAETCPKTNPGLYYPTRNYIVAQILCAVVFVAISACTALGARRFMLYIAHLNEGPGCSDAVHALPKVAGGAPELIAADGEVKACPICLDALTDGAVTTPCTHYFHEECLATWCASHLDCPLCRQAVGEPDDQKKGEDKV